MRKYIALFAVLAIFITADVFAANMSDIMPVLKKAKQDINATLTEIGIDLQTAAKALSGMDLKSDEVRKILTGLRKFRPYVVNCAILDADGVKITIEPAEYKEFEGVDRSDQPYAIELLKTKKPAMSDVYHSTEGMNAISIGYPIFSSTGELQGAVRMLIRHEAFLKPLVGEKPCDIWVMQPNGLLVYDKDPEQVGLNIFSDSMFKPFDDLIAFSKTVALSKTGAGSYKFYTEGLKDKTLAEKIAAWDTAGLYGTEWRVVAMEIEKAAEQPAEKSAAGK